FIYSPIIVGVDITIMKLIMAIVTALIGMAAVSSSMIGFFIRNSKLWERGVLLIGGLLMITLGLYTNLIGLALILLVVLVQKQRKQLESQIELRHTIQVHL